MGYPKITCDRAECRSTAITNLDGDNLCQTHADAWVHSEGEHAQECAMETDISDHPFSGRGISAGEY